MIRYNSTKDVIDKVDLNKYVWLHEIDFKRVDLKYLMSRGYKMYKKGHFMCIRRRENV